MLNIKLIREYPDKVKKACLDKNDTADIDQILDLDGDRRKLLTETEALRAEQNRASEEIAKVKKAGGDASEAIQVGHREVHRHPVDDGRVVLGGYAEGEVQGAR